MQCFVLVAAVVVGLSASGQSTFRISPGMSLVEARDRARRMPKPVQVVLAEGVYGLSSALTFGPEDSDVEWVAEGKGAVFSGAKKLTGWKVRADGLWEASIPRDEDGRNEWFETLWAGDERLVRARYPDTGFFQLVALDETVTTNKVGGKRQVAASHVAAVSPDVARLMSGLDADALRFAQLCCHHKWTADRWVIRAVEDGGNRLHFAGRPFACHNMPKTNSLYYVENVRGALNRAGEWLYDASSGKIRYVPHPGERIGDRVFTYAKPGLGRLVEIAGEPEKGRFVSRLRFRNIRFSHSDSAHPSGVTGGQAAVWSTAMVVADGLHEGVFDRCACVHAGEYALWLRRGCVSNKVTNCRFADLGAGGVRIGVTSRKGSDHTQPSAGEHVTVGRLGPVDTFGTVVDNCLVEKGGLRYPEGVGVLIGHSPFNCISHCEIRDLRYSGISVGWVWGYRGSVAQGNLIAFNRIHDIGLGQLSDMGGVYLLGAAYGTRVVGNVIHDVVSRGYGGWGIYTDEGSEGVGIASNLVYDTKCACFHQHYGKENVIANNVFVNGGEDVVAATRVEREHCVFRMERNVIASCRKDGILMKNMRPAQATAVWTGNLFYSAANVAGCFAGKGFEAFQAVAPACDNVFADPLFVDPERKNFDFKRQSPVWALGFVPWDYSRAGLLH